MSASAQGKITDIKLFTYGRLNPGTPGHISIIDRMIAQSREYIDDLHITPDIHFILSNTVGGRDNPFYCEGDANDKIYKKSFFMQMITNMVSRKYPEITFIINPDVENIVINDGKRTRINIYVKCAPLAIAYMHSIINNSTTLIHFFFGDDQRGFANTLETQLISRNVASDKTILERELCLGGIDLKHMNVDEICDIVDKTDMETLASLCSSSAIKKLVESENPCAHAAIHKIYSTMLDEPTINKMIVELRAALLAARLDEEAKAAAKEEAKAATAAAKAAKEEAKAATAAAKATKKKTIAKTTVKPLPTVDKITERGKVLKASGISIPSSPRPAPTAIIEMSNSPRSPLTATRATRRKTTKGGNRMRTRKTRRTKKTRRRRRKTKKR